MMSQAVEAVAMAPSPSSPLAEAPAPDRRAWVALGCLWFVYVLNFLDRQLLSILAKPIQDTLHITDGQLGLIGGLYFAAFYCFIAIPVGWLADRTNRVAVLAIACGVWSAATMACGVAKTYGRSFAVARMTVGFGEAGGVPPSYAIITDYFPPGRRGRALGLYNLGPPVGAALGVAFGASIAAAFSWRDAFLATGAVGIVAALVDVPRARAQARRTGPRGGRGGAAKGRLLAKPCGCSSPIRCCCWCRWAAARPSSSPMAWAISPPCS
jgi:MFS family permease